MVMNTPRLLSALNRHPQVYSSRTVNLPPPTLLKMLLFCGGMTLLLGCGSGHPPTTVVSGKITLAGKTLPKAGAIYFTPLEGALKRPGVGEFDANGNYTVRSWNEGDGLLPGKYKVSVECWVVPPTMGGAPKSYIPDKYCCRHQRSDLNHRGRRRKTHLRYRYPQPRQMIK